MQQQVYKVEWTPDAKADLWTITDFIIDVEQNIPLAEDIYQDLIEAGEKLATLPRRGVKTPARETHRLKLTKLPYVLHYSIIGNTAWILRLLHQHRGSQE